MEDLVGHAGKHVVLFCANYIYEGVLNREDHEAVYIDEPAIIYQTGRWDQADWTRSERLPIPTLKIERSAIESSGLLDRTVFEQPKKPARRR